MTKINSAFVVSFSGRLTADKASDLRVNHIEESNIEFDMSYGKAVRYLNDRSDWIGTQIGREVKRLLPAGVTVETSIDFYEGSVEYEGIVFVLDWMARIGSAAGLVLLLEKAIDTSIKRTIRKEAPRELSNFSISSQTVVDKIEEEEPPQNSVTSPSNQASPQPPGVPSWVWSTTLTLVFLNTIAVMFLLGMQYSSDSEHTHGSTSLKTATVAPHSHPSEHSKLPAPSKITLELPDVEKEAVKIQP